MLWRSQYEHLGRRALHLVRLPRQTSHAVVFLSRRAAVVEELSISDLTVEQADRGRATQMVSPFPH